MNRKLFEEVYRIVGKIPRGKVMTYGEIARRLKVNPRVVGFSLRRNPNPVIIPCHRVVGKNGELTGYARGVSEKKRLLEKEGVTFLGGKVDLRNHLW